MNLRILTEFEYNRKLFDSVAKITTDFAKREEKEYEGWCVEEVDCNGPEASIYTNDGKFNYLSRTNPYVGIRPATSYNEISESAKLIKEYENGLKEVEFGEYPQEIVEDYLQEQLNQDLLDSRLEATGKKYTIYNNDEENPDVIRLIEVVDKNGNKYVNKNDNWYKVSPVRWIVNEKENIALTKYMIQGGIPYGEYKLPPMTEWEIEYEKRNPRKLPNSVIKMHELRRVNPTIIEGFLNVVLSQDIMKDNEKVVEQTNAKDNDRRVNNHTETIFKNPNYQRKLNGWLWEDEAKTSEEYFQKLLESLEDDKIKLEAAQKYLHPTLQEQYVEGKRALRKTLIDYKKNR